MLPTTNMLWLWLLFIINSYQHPLNILSTEHLTHIIHTHNLLWCWLLGKINSYDSYQHPLNIMPTYYQHLSYGEPEDKLWGWVAYGLIVDKMWGICWFCPHKLPTFCRSCHCTTAPKNLQEIIQSIHPQRQYHVYFWKVSMTWETEKNCLSLILPPSQPLSSLLSSHG